MARSLLARWIMCLVLGMFSLWSHAQSAAVLQFVETSSTDNLTITNPGIPLIFTPTYIGPDQWTVNVTLPAGISLASISLFGGGSWSWREPGSTDEVNRVVYNATSTSFFDVFSDLVVDNSDFELIPVDGTLQAFGLLTWVEDNDFNELPIDIMFVDKGDRQVPEPGMLSLIGLSLVALGWSRRRRAQG